MKKIVYLLIALLAISLVSCDKEKCGYSDFQINEPIFMPEDEFRNSLAITVAQPIGETGTICSYDGYIFLSNPEKGIHIIDNRDPKAPQNVAYINLLGNQDIYIKNQTLYANAFVDFVWFDISNPATPEWKGRLENAFPDALPMIDNNFIIDHDMVFGKENTGKGIVVGWKVETKRVKAPCDDVHYNTYVGPFAKSTTLPIFAEYRDLLFVNTFNSLYTIRLSEKEPTKNDEVANSYFFCESIFTYKDFLFLRSPTSTYITPSKLPINHDQIVYTNNINLESYIDISNDLLFSTYTQHKYLSSVHSQTHQLLVYDISNGNISDEIASYALTSPKGLAIENEILFICDDGLKVFQVQQTGELTIDLLTHYKTIHGGKPTFLGKNTLLLIADDGLYQYDYSNLKEIKLLSKLSVGK